MKSTLRAERKTAGEDLHISVEIFMLSENGTKKVYRKYQYLDPFRIKYPGFFFVCDIYI